MGTDKWSGPDWSRRVHPDFVVLVGLRFSSVSFCLKGLLSHFHPFPVNERFVSDQTIRRKESSLSDGFQDSDVSPGTTKDVVPTSNVSFYSTRARTLSLF